MDEFHRKCKIYLRFNKSEFTKYIQITKEIKNVMLQQNQTGTDTSLLSLCLIGTKSL